MNYLDGAILLRGHSNLEKMFCLYLNFYSDISFTSSEINSYARSKLCWRVCAKNQICVPSLSHINRFFGYYFVLLFCYSGNPIFVLIHSTPIKVELS